MSEPRWTDLEFCRAVRAVGVALDRSIGSEYAPMAYVTVALAGRVDLIDGPWEPMAEVAGPLEADARRKFRRAFKRGLVRGCNCGCRADVELLPPGVALLVEAGDDVWRVP